MAHTGEMTPNIGARLSNYCESEGMFPEEQRGFHPACSTHDIISVGRRLHGLAQKKRSPRYACFIDLIMAYDSADQELLWIMPK